VVEAAERLARADIIDRPVLNDWRSLVGYLDAAPVRSSPGRLRVLFLDNRNRLIADEMRATEATEALMTREVTARACALKGNINAKGRKIFHAPGQRDYAVTAIDTTRGERWFCSAAEAIAAGWIPAAR
jgi:hypothetical protein